MRLFIVTSRPESLPTELKGDLSVDAVHQSDEIRTFFEASVESRPETSRASVKGGGAMTVVTKGPRWIKKPGPGVAPGATATKAGALATESETASGQLATDQRGGVLFRIPIGRGAVYVLLDEYAWTNGGLDQGDNALVLAGLLESELQKAGVLAFDEYRHGHGRAESFLVFLVNLPGAKGLFWLSCIWLLLYYYGRNVRLKPVEVYVERQRRTAQEYIDAVAGIYERARAAPLVVLAVARRLRQVSRSSVENSPEVLALLETAQEYVDRAERPAAPTVAIGLVKQLIQVRKRNYGTRAAS